MIIRNERSCNKCLTLVLLLLTTDLQSLNGDQTNSDLDDSTIGFELDDTTISTSSLSTSHSQTQTDDKSAETDINYLEESTVTSTYYTESNKEKIQSTLSGGESVTKDTKDGVINHERLQLVSLNNEDNAMRNSTTNLIKEPNQMDLMSTSLLVRTIFVSLVGTDSDHCGSDSEPCQSLHQAVQNSRSGDIIHILPSTTTQNQIAFCANKSLDIKHSLTIIMDSDAGIIAGCENLENENRLLMINISSVSAVRIQFLGGTVATVMPETIVVKFQRVWFINTLILMKNAEVKLYSCHMENTQLRSEGGAIVTVEMNGTEMTGHTDELCLINCTSTSHVELKSDVIRLKIDNSTFRHTKLSINANKYIKADVTSTLFTWSVNDDKDFLGGIELNLKSEEHHSIMKVLNSTFERQRHNDPIHSLVNILDADVLVRVVDTKRNVPGSNVSVVIRDCRFLDGERGVTLIGPFNFVNITDSTFETNTAMHAGAAILYLMDSTSVSNVEDCSFKSNAAGSFRPEQIHNHMDSFRISQDEVHVHSACCKGIIEFVGKGGAIRVQRGKLHLSRSIFVNNTARLLGGAVFVDRDSELIVNEVTFENSADDYHSSDGDFLYSNGKVTILNGNFLAVTADSHVSILRHSSDHWSIEVASVYVLCPEGYRLRISNASAYGVSPVGLKRSFRLDQLSYICEACPRHRYSLERGYLNYSLVYSDFSYFTLLVNGTTPNQAYKGTYEYHDIKCLPCPYGARCLQGISALPNFWGYIHEGRVRFQHCPKRYCVSTPPSYLGSYSGSSERKPNVRFDRCAPFRTGVLCGLCSPNYSQALFSPDCIPDDLCDITWLFPVMLGSGVIYFLFLLYQKNIRDMMFQNNDVMKTLLCACHWRKNRSSKEVRKNSAQVSTSSLSHEKTVQAEYNDYEGYNSIINRNGGRIGTISDYSSAAEDTTITDCSNFYNNSEYIRLSKTPFLRKKRSRSRKGTSGKDYDNIVDVGINGKGCSGNDGNGNADDPSQCAPPFVKKLLAPPADMGASFLIIVFFYFQDAQLLQIKTGTSLGENENRSFNLFKEFLIGLFKFRIEFVQFIDQLCFVKGLDATTKLVIRVLLVPYVLLQFGVVYLIFTWFNDRNEKRKKRTNSYKSSGAKQSIRKVDTKKKENSYQNCQKGFPIGERNQAILLDTDGLTMKSPDGQCRNQINTPDCNRSKHGEPNEQNHTNFKVNGTFSHSVDSLDKTLVDITNNKNDVTQMKMRNNRSFYSLRNEDADSSNLQDNLLSYKSRFSSVPAFNTLNNYNIRPMLSDSDCTNLQSQQTTIQNDHNINSYHQDGDQNYSNPLIDSVVTSSSKRSLIGLSEAETTPTQKVNKDAKASFSISLTTGFVLALLFTYQKLATTSFTLLNCVPVGHQMVLLIDGSINCYQVWQYGVGVYAITCIVPFSLVLLIGPGLLRDSQISLKQFFFASIIPLPFLVRWIWIRLRPRRCQKSAERPRPKKLSPDAQAMLQILQGPFKESQLGRLGPICGQGILLGRRLVMVLLFTFVNDVLLRMLGMMLLCFVILLHHAHSPPYKDKRANTAGSASASALVVIAGINLVRAAFESAEYIPHGPNAILMKVFDEIENMLILWFPGVIMAFIIISLILKLFAFFIKSVSKICRAGKTESSVVVEGDKRESDTTVKIERSSECLLSGSLKSMNRDQKNNKPSPVFYNNGIEGLNCKSHAQSSTACVVCEIRDDHAENDLNIIEETANTNSICDWDDLVTSEDDQLDVTNEESLHSTLYNTADASFWTENNSVNNASTIVRAPSLRSKAETC